MRGELSGLKTLILNENECAFYVHCFAHQLQLALVAVAKNHIEVASLFNLIGGILNIVGSSCKRRDILHGKHAKKINDALKSGEISSGQGLNQEINIKRAGETRWGSHYNTLVSLIVMFPSVIEVLELVMEEGLNSEQKAEACVLLDSMHSFDFVFNLHVMRNILGVTNELSQALQRKDQDILNAMTLVKVSKQRLQKMRDSDWDLILNEISIFCNKYSIVVPDMNEMFIARGRSRRKAQAMTNAHHYRVELFYTIIDMQVQELNNRFTEVNTELLLCVACLNPSDAFSAFNKQRLIRLAQFYPTEFSTTELILLDNQLETYIMDVQSNEDFSELKGIGSLSEKMVKTKKNVLYPLVYQLIILALILPVATATVERAFSAMKIVKNRLRNRMADQWMNDCLITYIEKDIFDTIDNETIIQRFQHMKTRRGQL